MILDGMGSPHAESADIDTEEELFLGIWRRRRGGIHDFFPNSSDLPWGATEEGIQRPDEKPILLLLRFPGKEKGGNKENIYVDEERQNEWDLAPRAGER